MDNRAHKSLSLKAILYVVAICAAIIAFEGWREWMGHDAALTRAELGVQNLSRSLRQHAEDTYEIAEQAVSMVVYEVGITGTDDKGLAQTKAFMQRVMDGAKRLHSLSIFGPDGRWLVTTDRQLPNSTDYSRLAFFRNHQASISKSVFFGAPIPSVSDGSSIMTVSRRIEDANGKFAGVAVAAIDSRYFTELYKSIEIGSLGTITLYNTAGRLLALQPYVPGAIGLDLSEGELFDDHLATRDTGAYVFSSDPDRVTRIGGYDRGAHYPVVAVVAVARDEALSNWWQGAVMRGLLTLGFAVLVGVLGIWLAEQIGRRQRSETVLEQKEAEFRLLAESASDLVERFDSEGMRTYISPALERLVGYKPEELLGKSAFDAVHEDDRQAIDEAAERLRTGASEQETVQFRRPHRDGRELWLETSLRVAAEASRSFSVVGVTRDITDRKHLELRLENMAMQDGLTGLSNRRAFDVALAREVGRSRRSGEPLSLLMIDADRFKRFNDDYGHVAGDACLKAMASVVALAARRPTDVAARFGGEELALLLPGTPLEAARTIASDLCRQVQALAIPHQRNLPWKTATISIGVASIDPRDLDDFHDGDWLVSTADLALYDAKAQGRNQHISVPKRPIHARLLA